MSNAFLSNAFNKQGIDDTLGQMLGVEPSGSAQLKSVQFQDQSAVNNALKELGTDGSPVDWILLDYAGPDHKVLKLTKKGAGKDFLPPTAVQNDLDDNKVQYLLLTQPGGVRQGYALITWEGAKAPAASKQASNVHKKELHAFLGKQFHALTGKGLQAGELRG